MDHGHGDEDEDTAESPAPAEAPVERRHFRRRDEDSAAHEIFERARHETPLVLRLVRTGKVSLMVGSLLAMAGGVGGALGYRVAGPGSDVKAVRVTLDTYMDSTEKRIEAIRIRVAVNDSVLRDAVERQKFQSYLLCMLLRRTDQSALPDGCSPIINRPPGGGTRRP